MCVSENADVFLVLFENQVIILHVKRQASHEVLDTRIARVSLRVMVAILEHGLKSEVASFPT